jgi:CyaY protein
MANAAAVSTRGAVATTLPNCLDMPRLSTVSSAPLRRDDLSDAEYDRRARAVLAAVEAATDRFLQDDVIDIDAGRTGGLLELTFPNGSKIVLNTQPPLHELWLAAGSGGFHFRAVGERWVDRDGHELFDVLSQCATAQAGRALRFDP